ncbi:polyprenyl synthetase family protein [Anaerotalea alkaliphila]|uniref:Farnesyl diphosphate synthase n=1 Tax=Anaerotalea alkaliphila TaxID=2662126 RepID=A0A7X5KM16_9FIRM|nr:farnesyl diphosphate synthase [Anaerotalea alkaliphila]NDL66258.1 polyprenyl synthetase family protein [Anaerotalea alkaliphila]
MRVEEKELEGILASYLPVREEPYNAKVLEAMAYSYLAGGKRLRPRILEAVCAQYGLEPPLMWPFMAAIEMIHTYSLVHDDLPAMDDDVLRRGLPTCHVRYGEATAILAGDALLNRAYEVMLQACLHMEDKKAGLEAARALAAAAGSHGMVGGQSADMESQELESGSGEEVLAYIHAHKTGSILEAAFVMGGILARQPESVLQKLRKMGASMGMAFQIQDDLLDLVASPVELGKTNSDERNSKLTYVSVHGEEAAEAAVAACFKEVYQLLTDLRFGADGSLWALVQEMENRKK